ncbi:MAG: tyrosine-type recombinase/integrase, partial [Thermoplasmatota archaeon]
MHPDKLVQCPEVKKCLAGKAEKTKKTYLTALKVYTSYRNMDPEQLIDEIEADWKKPRRERGEVEYKLKEFHTWLRKEKEKQKPGTEDATEETGVSPKWAHTILGAIRSFYKSNGFPLNLKLPPPTTLKKNHKLKLRAEDVKKLVDHAPTLRDKAVILMLFQTGMDVSTLCSLDYGDVARGLEKKECPLTLHVVR